MAPHPLPLEYSIDVRDYFRHADAGGCSFDAQHVPQINYDLVFRAHRILSGRTFGTHYNITSVCQYGLGALSLFLETGEERFRELFSAQAKWLSENLVTIRNSYGVWQYQFPFLPYRLKPPFVSGMAQGQGLSVLVRAWQLCQDPRYMDQAHLVFNSFAVQVSEGGVKQLTPQGRTWYEEYPTEPPSYVLNGYIFALFGIRDYYLATMSKPAQFAWEEGNAA